MKSALCYDWLVTRAGGEKVLDAVLEAYPSPIYTLVHNKKTFQTSQAVHTSFIQHLPFSSRLYRNYFPLFPLAIEQFDLRGYDLILSLSHTAAKGVLTTANQLHLCYCFTPVRYAWDLTHQYLQGVNGMQKGVAKYLLHRLRSWDIASLGRVDHFATLSHYVARRIKKIYGKESTVIYPPVDVDKIKCGTKKEDYYFTVSRMVPYKRIDLLVEALSHFPDKRLVVVGAGPEMKKIRSKAGKNVELLGWQPDCKVKELMANAKGFLFAAEEDFGIVVVEAQAAGTPVIAFGKGGSLETVVPGKTGLFFSDQSVSSLCSTLVEFEKREWDPIAIRQHALPFNRDRVIGEFKQFVTEKYEAFCEIHHSGRR